MKKFMITMLLLALFGTSTTLLAQNQNNESLGLPGDNLNLYAVMKLFQSSETLEGFERSLNDPNSRINNLDLNGDNQVDYIRVIDNVDGDVHNIVLQVAINNRENQDVAVFTVQKDRDGRVYIQLIGDRDLYGKDYIIEPIYNEGDSGQTPNPGYTGQNIAYSRTSPAEIAGWPVVRFIFMPNYVSWHSSWYYGSYPSYWHTWHPFYWDYYYGYQYNSYNDYYGHFQRASYQRYTRFNDYYYVGHRAYSPVVRSRIDKGNYRSTYSKPSQRQTGEAAFIKTHPDQVTRRPDPANGKVNVQKPGAQPAPDRRPTGISNQNGRSKDNVNKTNSARPVTNPQPGKDANTSRQTTPPRVSNKADERPTNIQNVNTPRRDPATVTNRTESKPPTQQKVSAPKPSKESSTNKASTQSRRSIFKSKKETTVKQNNKAKSTETPPPTQRR
jgi:hypothetical protein